MDFVAMENRSPSGAVAERPTARAPDENRSFRMPSSTSDHPCLQEVLPHQTLAHEGSQESGERRESDYEHDHSAFP